METETKKITHWFNWKEWKSMVDDAYNEENDLNAYYRALETIKVWEARDSNLPSALLCLKELIIGRISRINKTSNNIDTYQSSLSMNIVRFVNIITEPYQKNIYAKPVKNIALEIGLPNWIVNIRHSATHYNLPSIELLEKALDDLFFWLKEKYVNNYKETAVEKSLLSDVKLSIQNLFVDYMNSQYKVTVMRNNKKQTQDLSEEPLAKIETMICQFRNETFAILVEDGFMIPTKEQLTTFGIVPEEFLEQENLYIPKSFLNIWTTFLAYCNDNNLIQLIFQNLITAYRLECTFTFDNDPLREKFLLSWIVCLLKLNSFKNDKSKNVKYYFEYSFKKVLLDVLGCRSSHLGIYFLNEISKLPSFSKEINQIDLEKLRAILDFVNMANVVEINPNDPDDGQNQMDTNDQLEYNMALFEIKNKPDFFTSTKTNSVRSKQTKSDWQLIDDSDWNQENLKIGIVEGQSYLNLNLDINQFYETNKRADENSMNLSSYNNQLQASLNGGKSNQTLNSRLNFCSRSNIEVHKKSLMANYWEFSG